MNFHPRLLTAGQAARNYSWKGLESVALGTPTKYMYLSVTIDKQIAPLLLPYMASSARTRHAKED